MLDNKASDVPDTKECPEGARDYMTDFLVLVASVVNGIEK